MVLYQYSFLILFFIDFFCFILEFKYSFYVIVYMAVTVSFFVFCFFLIICLSKSMQAPLF